MPSRKYVLDPSVTSNPYGVPTRNMYQPQPVPSFQNNNYGSPTPITPLVPSNNNYVPNPAPLVPNPSFNPSPLVPNPPLNPTPLVPNAQPPPSMTSEIGQPATEKYIPTSAPGWNDPPLLHKPLRSQVNNLYNFFVQVHSLFLLKVLW